MSIKIKHVINHHLIKTKENENYDDYLSNEYIPANDKDNQFVTELQGSYNKKITKVFGVFNSDSGDLKRNEFSTVLQKYLQNPTSQAFLNSTRTLAKSLAFNANKVSSKQGTTCFIHYSDNSNEEEQQDYFFVAILDDVTSFNPVISSKKHIHNPSYTTDSSHGNYKSGSSLDINNIRIAARINLTKYQAILESQQQETQPQEDIEEFNLYISFLSKHNNLTGFFQEFIGCTTPISSKSETQKLVDFISDYLRSKVVNKEISTKDSIIKRNEILNYLNDMVNNKTFFNKEEFACRLDFDNSEEVLAGLDEKQISSGIKIYKSLLKDLSHIHVTDKSTGFELSIPRADIANKQIFKNAKGYVILKNPPETLLEILEFDSDNDSEG